MDIAQALMKPIKFSFLIDFIRYRILSNYCNSVDLIDKNNANYYILRR